MIWEHFCDHLRHAVVLVLTATLVSLGALLLRVTWPASDPRTGLALGLALRKRASQGDTVFAAWGQESGCGCGVQLLQQSCPRPMSVKEAHTVVYNKTRLGPRCFGPPATVPLGSVSFLFFFWCLGTIVPVFVSIVWVRGGTFGYPVCLLYTPDAFPHTGRTRCEAPPTTK